MSTICPSCCCEFNPTEVAADYDGSLCEKCEEKIATLEASLRPIEQEEA
jgi:hypothetical protein